MVSNKQKQLLVEGIDDLLAVVGLMEHHVEWSRDKRKAPVWIDAVGSINEILDSIFLQTKMKESGLHTLGILIDADEKPSERWQSLRGFCLESMPELPRKLPKKGLIVDCSNGLRFGCWIMPDCSSKGMMETFLTHLVPGESADLWRHAESSVNQSKQVGAKFIDKHFDKARIHTWLSWQDPPGERMGLALTKKILDPRSSKAVPFVKWFKNLYNLQ